MSRCRKCNVEIKDHTQVCPLCHCVLEEAETEENTYPDIRFMTRKLNFAMRIFLYLEILLEVLFIYLEWAGKIAFGSSIISGTGMLYLYMACRFVFLNNNAGYRSKFLGLTFGGIGYVILIDYVVGYQGWSVNYVLPAGMIFVDVAILFVMLINRRNWQSYLILQLAMIFISGCLILLWFAGIVTKPFLSGLAFVIAVLLFVGTMIIGDRRARLELKRRFHVR